MQFYHAITTEKSFKHLQLLKQRYDFILIGGWAVFLYSHSLKSKDIDIILDYQVLTDFKNEFEVAKNDRLKKYEVKLEDVDVDIYLPFYSDLGIKIEDVQANTVIKEGFKLPILELLFLLKLYAWQARRGSIKGRKDELDIFSLAVLPEFGWKKYKSYVKKFGFGKYNTSFQNLIKGTISIKELNFNQSKMSKLKKSILVKLI